MSDITLSVFVDEWISKSIKYDDRELIGAFDKFFSLFVLYNALYREATNKLRFQSGKAAGKDCGGATKDAPALIGYETLYETLNENCESEISEIADLISSKKFHVHSKGDPLVPDYDEDLKYTNFVRGQDKEKYCLGILRLIYKTRCNMFHGEKSYKNIQIELLRPMNKILTVVIGELRKKLFI